MKILDILRKEFIIDRLKSKDKNGVLKELAEVLVENGKVKDLKKVVETLQERERLGSTGIGDGVAIPHGKVKGFTRIVAAFGRSLDGIDFDSIDGKPVHLFFLLLAPEKSAGDHLKALARIARLMNDKSFRDELMAAKDGEEIYNIIAKEEEKF